MHRSARHSLSRTAKCAHHPKATHAFCSRFPGIFDHLQIETKFVKGSFRWTNSLRVRSGGSHSLDYITLFESQLAPRESTAIVPFSWYKLDDLTPISWVFEAQLELSACAVALHRSARDPSLRTARYVYHFKATDTLLSRIPRRGSALTRIAM